MSDKDEQEKILYRNFIDAQYAYLKYIEPIKVEQINKRISGKVLNPFHWRTMYEATKIPHGDEIKTSPKENTKKYKRILLVVHPDKNPDRIEEATKYFQFIQDLISNDDTDRLNEIAESGCTWDKIRDMYENDSLYDKEKYCKKAIIQRWYSWSSDDDAQYISEEELVELLRAKNTTLREENEKLRKYNDMLKEYMNEKK